MKKHIIFIILVSVIGRVGYTQSRQLIELRREMDSLSKSHRNTSLPSEQVLYYYYNNLQDTSKVRRYRNLKYLLGNIAIPLGSVCKWKSLNGLEVYYKGGIPECIKKLDQLSFLSIGSYKPKIVPDIFYTFKDLLVLIITYPNARFISDGINTLQKLEVLHIMMDRMKKFPLSVCELTKLYELQCYTSRPIKLPTSFVKLKKLRKLHINLDLQDEKSIDVLCQMTQLEELTLYNRRLKKIPEKLACLSSLKKLFLYDAKFNTEQRAKLSDILPKTRIKGFH